ncbi:MAG: phosphatidate cytidylyltransferase [Candidatus Kapaibacteriales bacterium]
MKDLTKRIIIAVIGIPITIAIIYLNKFIFFLFLLLLSNLTLSEFYNLAKYRNYAPNTFWGYLINSFSLFLFYVFLNTWNITDANQTIFIIIIVFFLTPFILLLRTIWSKMPKVTENFSITFFGLFWINFSFIALLLVRSLPLVFFRIKEFGLDSKLSLTTFPMLITDNWSFLFFISILGSIWICDSFAYFIGTAFGKHKLAPSVSPKKSWEGAIAGVIGAILSFYLFDTLFELSIKKGFLLLFSFVVGIIGQLGDLAESKIKRDFNVKDSSNLLPGHGGLLDRLDSIIFVYPTILIIIMLSSFIF